MCDINKWLKTHFPDIDATKLSYDQRKELVYNFVEFDASEDELRSLIFDEESRFAPLDEQEFLRYVLNGEIRYEDFRPNKKYSIKENRLEVDQYVNQVLKEYFPEIKERIGGYTRSGRYNRCLHTLARYALPLHKKTNIYNNDKFHDIYKGQLNKLRQMLLDANGGKKYDTISLTEAMHMIPTNTSAGYSFPGKKKYEVASEALRRATQMQHRIQRGLFTAKLPCTIAVRGHLSKIEENKSRPIWVMPYETILLECSMVAQIYKMLKADQTLPFITGDNSMSRLYTYLQSHSNLPQVVMDISAWDIMRGKFIIYDVFNEVLRPIINMTPDEEKVWKWTIHDYTETHFMLPSGIVLSKSCGIPSGTYYTLLMNSLINWTAQSTVLKYLEIDFYDLQILGDDSSFFGHVSDEVLERYSYCLTFYFGMISHRDKVKVSRLVSERKYIGYTFRGVRLHRDTDDWFRMALLPEREIFSLNVSFTRVFSYLLIGGINDVDYYDFFTKYLNIYLDRLRSNRDNRLDDSIFKSGPLRVFKHALNMDLDFLATINIDKILKFNFFMMPFFFSCNYDIKTALDYDAAW